MHVEGAFWLWVTYVARFLFIQDTWPWSRSWLVLADVEAWDSDGMWDTFVHCSANRAVAARSVGCWLDDMLHIYGNNSRWISPVVKSSTERHLWPDNRTTTNFLENSLINCGYFALCGVKSVKSIPHNWIEIIHKNEKKMRQRHLWATQRTKRRKWGKNVFVEIQLSCVACGAARFPKGFGG
jgi:hypothetical protein